MTKNEVVIALAEDLRTKVADKLMAGYELQRKMHVGAISLEQINELNRFYVITDDILASVGLLVSNESSEERTLENQIVSLEGLFDRLKGLIRRKKKGVKTQRREDPDVDTNAYSAITWLEYFDERTIKEVTNQEFVEIGKSVAGFFLENNRVIKDIPQRLKRDVAAFKSFYGQLKPGLNRATGYIATVNKTLNKFHGDPSRPDEFAAAVVDLTKKAPPHLVETVKDPVHNFMGLGRIGFVEEEDGLDVFSFDGPLLHLPYAEDGIDVPSLDLNELKGFVKDLKGLLSLQKEVEEFIDDNDLSGLDITDAPIRGYMGGSVTDELMDAINDAPFLHPVFELRYTNIVNTLNTLLEEYLRAFSIYVRKHLNT